MTSRDEDGEGWTVCSRTDVTDVTLCVCGLGSNLVSGGN